MGYYLEGHSTSPKVMIPATRAFHQTARLGAHGFRSHRLRPLLMLCKYCRIRVNIATAIAANRLRDFIAESSLLHFIASSQRTKKMDRIIVENFAFLPAVKSLR